MMKVDLLEDDLAKQVEDLELIPDIIMNLDLFAKGDCTRSGILTSALQGGAVRKYAQNALV
jgi:hypothetical protein